jgi:ribosome maturation factor RimP
VALIDDIEKIVKSHGAVLYDSEIVQENGETIFRIYILKEGGVDLDLCADISRDISPILDITAPVSGEYRFEVSSPGIERKLSKKEHFLHSIGSKVKVKILGGQKLKGELVAADDKGISVQTKDGLEKFSYDQLGTVKTYFEW